MPATVYTVFVPPSVLVIMSMINAPSMTQTLEILTRLTWGGRNSPAVGPRNRPVELSTNTMAFPEISISAAIHRPVESPNVAETSPPGKLLAPYPSVWFRYTVELGICGAHQNCTARALMLDSATASA